METRTLGLCSSLLLFLLLQFSDLHFAVAADPLKSAPSPAPEIEKTPSPSPTPLSPETAGAPFHSPPAPSPSDLVPTPSPTPSPEPSSPSPSPSDASIINHDSKGAADSQTADSKGSSSSDGGLKGGQKAGIAIGVIAAVCVVGLFGFIYKKRQDNIQRSQYGYAARRELL